MIRSRWGTAGRQAIIKWRQVENADEYNIYTGTEPDKLYNCIIVHIASEYYYKAMDKLRPYYFSMEAINENGIAALTISLETD